MLGAQEVSVPDGFVPYRPPVLTTEQARERGEACFERFESRRSVRHFSDRPVPRHLVELALRAASTAPSGAHQQPWTFAVVGAPDLKRRIRLAAEAEERRTYHERMTDEWRAALQPLGTDWHKPYLEVVPWLVVLFAQRWGIDAEGKRHTHYYVTESCGIAAGLFIAALHEMGLSTVTHTPSPMTFLSDLLGRPANEKPMTLFPIGYAAADAQVPDLHRKSLDEISVWYE